MDDDGTLVRRLVSCQEALRVRHGLEALDDYQHLLHALQAFGPPDVREANDLSALIRGVEAYRARLNAKTA